MRGRAMRAYGRRLLRSRRSRQPGIPRPPRARAAREETGAGAMGGPAQPRSAQEGRALRREVGWSGVRLRGRVPLEPINPAGLATPETYTHVVVATGSRLVFVAGQVAEDERG